MLNIGTVAVEKVLAIIIIVLEPVLILENRLPSLLLVISNYPYYWKAQPCLLLESTTIPSKPGAEEEGRWAVGLGLGCQEYAGKGQGGMVHPPQLGCHICCHCGDGAC